MPVGDHGLAEAFETAMARLGPFEPRPVLAVAVSGGADSTALAILAHDWACRRGGSILGLSVDHMLRHESAQEAEITTERLRQLGIPAVVLPLPELVHGPALAERARLMRYETLAAACERSDVVHLLLGHHAEDQAETLAMRVLRASGTHGLAGMSALRETWNVRQLRPLLRIDPARLRQLLELRSVAWIEDPSNEDRRALRPRLRHAFRHHGLADTNIPTAMTAVARLRAREETKAAGELAWHAMIRPEGFALIHQGKIGWSALSSLVAAIGGAHYRPSAAQIRDLAARPDAATIGGVRIMQAGRLGSGLLMVREEAAISAPVQALPNIIWDNRFRVITSQALPHNATIGKLGDAAAAFRGASALPSAVLRTLPAIRVGGSLAAVPHLHYVAAGHQAHIVALFTPPIVAAGACFVPSA